MPEEKAKKKHYSKFYNAMLGILLSALFVCAYTLSLQRMMNETTLNHAIEENSKRTNAMYAGVQNFLTKEDFSEINDRADMSSELYRTLQGHLNEIRSMNSTRYFYTAKKNAEGTLIYLVDGLDYDADDFAYPGTAIEDEMVPYIERALSGEIVYSQDILDTTWGHIFTACYPIREQDSGEIMGSLCIEIDMESTYAFIEKCNQKAIVATASGTLIVVMILTCACIYLQNEHRKREERARALENMANAALAADRAKSTFLFNMSHDIRTPLNAIIGYLNLARKHLDDKERMTDYMDKIDNCSTNLLSMLSNVLDLARIESNKIVLEESPLNVEEAFRDCIEIFENTAAENKQDLTVSCDLSSSQVYLDKTRFSEIVMNLLSNALKYTGEGGKIHCEMHQEFSKERERWTDLIFSVADTGIGMSKEYQEKIFDAFSRERNTTEGGVEGSGIGMSIVKKLVDAMDGTIELNSEVGKGSTFTVTIPCRLVQESFAPKKRETEKKEKSLLEGRRILLAEDNDLNAEIAIELLEEEQMLVDRAADGVQCFEKIQKSPAGYYALILMDIQMPKLDGYQATAKIRKLQDAEKANIPIIAMTANAFSEDREKALQAGMNDHVAKPIDMEALFAAMLKYV